MLIITRTPSRTQNKMPKTSLKSQNRRMIHTVGAQVGHGHLFSGNWRQLPSTKVRKFDVRTFFLGRILEKPYYRPHRQPACGCCNCATPISRASTCDNLQLPGASEAATEAMLGPQYDPLIWNPDRIHLNPLYAIFQTQGPIPLTPHRQGR